MKQNYLNKLEYNKILELLGSYCHTFIGKKLANDLTPSNNKEDVKLWLSETEEAVNLIERNSTPPISEISDIGVYIKILDSTGILSAKALLDICNIFETAEDLKNYFDVQHISQDDFSNLNAYFSVLYSNLTIIDRIKKSVLDENTISDSASKNLQNIRKNQRRLEQDIKNKLNSIIHSSSYSKYIQENVVTIRNERYVIPVKDEYRTMIKGFIHDTSSSGSTVFVEPLAVFEYNNELNNLKIEENNEIQKILQEFSSLLYPYINELETDLKTIGQLDFIFAKARYSNSIKGTTPIINDEKFINLKNARHPLIDSKKVVPSSIELGKNFTTLVITGPNTGGKTVTLKTVGLLTCMACSGLNIPANEKSSIYVFDEVFADIGDDQSISDSLSTFSSHMTNIVDIINNSTYDSLILVDELGSGTDPLEGAALAISILEHFKNQSTLTISTTHYQELKKYALTTKNVENASVEFDIETMQPTYRLLIGIPGKSNAFAISQKIGLSEDIINNASSLLSKQDINIEDLLKNIYDNKSKIENEKKEIESKLLDIENLKESLQKDNSDLEEKRKELIESAKFEARQILEDAKDEATDAIKKIKDITQNNPELENLRNKLNDSIKDKSVVAEVADGSSFALPREEIVPNKKVFITTLNQNGIVLSRISKSDEVLVQVGLLKTNVDIKYLEKAKNDNSKKIDNGSYTSISKSRTAVTEINVIGLTVDEAIPIVDKFIDDSYLAKLKNVRIVHGKGTGKLRTGIQKFLKRNPHVESIRVGTYGEGEMGVTVVTIKY